MTAPFAALRQRHRDKAVARLRHALSAYDAACAAVASARGLRLVSGDAASCDAGLAIRPADATAGVAGSEGSPGS